MRLYICSQTPDEHILGSGQFTHRAKSLAQDAIDAMDIALESGKSYQVEIKLFDNSLKARQRALANIWYKKADEHFGTDPGYTEAYCKYKWGLVFSF